ncbi:Nudix family hydrolase [Lysobacter sp. TY2-98]|uniref:Nudix family hydrolase n=1 Tax=Lysobacter sp. TY2-98 TaxID=2290922 RepID=UPI000E200B70|nr:Nudix family hydrolase [Lysobacter sp. TY2-98]AXK70975.1 Nudix family hydrolase [Lysobacter sp. TY2-98]
MAEPRRSIHVVAGVIRDVRGRVLLARRTEGRDLAGLWEFPGGKCEPGETPEQALARELHEELGIDVRVGAPLIRVPQQYPDKALVLDVRIVESWTGTARGREGQALAWVPIDKLVRYDMPPADRPVVAALLQPPLYAVTPALGEEVAPWLDALSRALEAGARRVQLRSPQAPVARWAQAVGAAVALCRAAGAEVLLNGEIARARELGVGVHLRAAQLADIGARPLPADVSVAASCHDAADLAAAERLGCDFAVLGHVAPTPSHPDRLPIGWAGFAALRETASLPIYAIGGVGPSDVEFARAHGAQGVAGIRGFFGPAPLG